MKTDVSGNHVSTRCRPMVLGRKLLLLALRKSSLREVLATGHHKYEATKAVNLYYNIALAVVFNERRDYSDEFTAEHDF